MKRNISKTLAALGRLVLPIGIIAFAAVISFGLAGCDNGTTDGGKPDKVAVPRASPETGTYTTTQSVTLSCATSGAVIYYTIDGTTPTASSPVYTSPVSVTAAATIKAIAVKSGMTDSDVMTAVYTVLSKVAAPMASPETGTYTTAQSVTLSCATSGAVIYYTIDGTTPTVSSSVYTSPISVTAIIKAVAVKTGMADSDVMTAEYTVLDKVDAPTASPETGTYTTAQSITLSCAAGGAVIYYTIDGTAPTASSLVYTSPISVTAIIKAVAVKTGMADSDVMTAEYTVLPNVDQTFTIEYEQGTIILKNIEGAAVTEITLSKSSTPSTITLSAAGEFGGVIWYVDGENKGSGPSMELNAADYTAIQHSVTFTGWRNGSYLSSAPMPFMVNN
ncbi:MAG: chitobiase/beta-hexosaminidase C-terminal domain-containing protein [Treponema sp.]|nr:chitobiase/beta-hexosaminidase C-terminal domain-containing protein [Treponema sp.]